MRKVTQDSDVIDHKDTVYAENDIELSWPIKQGVVYDKNDARQLCDI